MTKRQAIRMVRAAERGYSGRNVTRWYSTVHPRRNGEARVLTWAVKTWQGKPLVMLAAEYNTDGSANHVSGRCLVNNFTHAPAFNWLDYGGRSHVAVWSDVDGCRDEWLEACDHEFGKGTEFYGQFLNGLEGTKYRYCAWDMTNMRLSDFLDCYKVSPMSELLAKARLVRWLTPSHVARLVKSKPLARFLARNADALRSVPPSIVQREFVRHGERADVAQMAALAELTPYGLTRLPIAPKRVWAWMLRNGVSGPELRHHVDNLLELRMDTAYEPHVLPHDWAAYSVAIDQRVREVREAVAEREREIVRKARAEARRIVDGMVERGLVRKRCKVVIPASETELVAEGNAMDNCVGSYWHSLCRGACDLFFVRRDGKPYIDVEVQGGKIVQARYSHNREVKVGSADWRMCARVAGAFRRAS